MNTFYLLLSLITALVPGPKKPLPESALNIIWITAEDFSLRLLAYGDSTVNTPHLDRLAKSGIVYDNAYSISGVCAPSRSALITGMYPTSIGTNYMRAGSHKVKGLPEYEAVPPSEVKCFTEFLRAQGYYCTNNSKTDYQFDTPFTAWDENGSKAHWRNRPPGVPFFSVFNFMATHESMLWDEEHWNKFMQNLPMKAQKSLHRSQRGVIQSEKFQNPKAVDPSLVEVPPYYPDTETVRKTIASQYHSLLILDRQIGQLLRKLEEDDLMDRTIIFFFGDHGDGFPRSKRWLYDSGIKVPLFIKFPDGYKAGERNNDLISFIDFPPTVLSLSGIKPPEYMHGQAFLGKYAAPPRKYIHAANDRQGDTYDRIRAVRDKRFKYIKYYEPEKPFVQPLSYRDDYNGIMIELLRLKKEGKLDARQSLWFRPFKPEEELFDCVADPHEINNLAENPAHRAKLKELRRVHKQWSKNYNDLGEMSEKEMVSMMWPNFVQPKTSDPILEIRTVGSEKQIVIKNATSGASIGYKLADRDGWKIYTEPIPIAEKTTLRAKAIRLGFKESDEIYFKVGH